MTRLRADALLLLTAIIWGTTFVAQKIANGGMPPIAFVAARFLISAVMLAPLAMYESRRAASRIAPRDIRIALVVGLCLAAGSVLQQAALLTTSVTNSGFLTALYVVLVPFAAWLVSRERIRPLVLAACVVSVTGAWLLTDTGATRTWATGDLLLVASDVPWAFSISLVAVYMRRTPRPFFLAFTQYAVTAVVAGAVAFAAEPVTLAGLEASAPAILYAGLLSGGIAYTLQIVAQSHTPPAEASLIMALESVFAAIAGAALLVERLTFTAMCGCALILAGVILVETGPALHRNIKAVLSFGSR